MNDWSNRKGDCINDLNGSKRKGGAGLHVWTFPDDGGPSHTYGTMIDLRALNKHVPSH